MNRRAALAVFALLSLPMAGSELWPGLEPGPHAVGYRLEHVYDSSRIFPGTSGLGRPIQISIWYPASGIEKPSPVKWSDYFHSAATEIDFSTPDHDRLTEPLEQVRAATAQAGADPERFQQLLDENTLASRDSLPAGGAFPLVVFVPGFGAPAFQNTVACEYLASHGFVVAAIPSMGEDGREMTNDEAGAEAQVRDIELVMKKLRDLESVDKSRTALIGYSWGGLTVTLAAMKGIDVTAVVALDGTLMVRKGHELARSFESYDPTAIKVPVMMMIANAKEWKERDVTFFDELSGTDVWLLRFHDLKHGDFGSIIIRFFVHSILDGGGRDIPRIDLGYATACRYLLAFFDTHLRDGEEGERFMSSAPEENGVPPGVVSVQTSQKSRPDRAVSVRGKATDRN